MIEIRDGKFKQTSKPLKTKTDVPSEAVRKYHKQNLDLAKERIESVSLDERDYSSITMAINPAKLGKAKKMISEFKQKLCKELESGEAEEVYTFAAQLFPISARKKKFK